MPTVSLVGPSLSLRFFHYREQQREEKEEADRKAREEAERQRRKAELAKPKTTVEVWLRGLFD